MPDLTKRRDVHVRIPNTVHPTTEREMLFWLKKYDKDPGIAPRRLTDSEFRLLAELYRIHSDFFQSHLNEIENGFIDVLSLAPESRASLHDWRSIQKAIFCWWYRILCRLQGFVG